jgi:hypothetical protein
VQKNPFKPTEDIVIGKKPFYTFYKFHFSTSHVNLTSGNGNLALQWLLNDFFRLKFQDICFDAIIVKDE